MINVFLLGYFAALMPSAIALTWFIWRAPALKNFSSLDSARSTRKRRDVSKGRPAELAATRSQLAVQRHIANALRR